MDADALRPFVGKRVVVTHCAGSTPYGYFQKSAGQPLTFEVLYSPTHIEFDERVYQFRADDVVSIRTIEPEEEQQLKKACKCTLTGDNLADHDAAVACPVHGLHAPRLA